ncbi:hypothetical protein A2U01_0105847, partial [Trifolium medium]|nr:hypothetical protein [Trifolium medium]
VNKSQPCEQCTAPGLELPKLGTETRKKKSSTAPGLVPPELGAKAAKSQEKQTTVCSWLGVFKLGAEARMC